VWTTTTTCDSICRFNFTSVPFYSNPNITICDSYSATSAPICCGECVQLSSQNWARANCTSQSYNVFTDGLCSEYLTTESFCNLSLTTSTSNGIDCPTYDCATIAYCPPPVCYANCSDFSGVECYEIPSTGTTGGSCGFFSNTCFITPGCTTGCTGFPGCTGTACVGQYVVPCPAPAPAPAAPAPVPSSPPAFNGYCVKKYLSYPFGPNPNTSICYDSAFTTSTPICCGGCVQLSSQNWAILDCQNQTYKVFNDSLCTQYYVTDPLCNESSVTVTSSGTTCPTYDCAFIGVCPPPVCYANCSDFTFPCETVPASTSGGCLPIFPQAQACQNAGCIALCTPYPDCGGYCTGGQYVIPCPPEMNFSSPAPCPVPFPAPAPLPVPAPVPAPPPPRVCFREYDGAFCSGNVTMQAEFSFNNCTELFNLTGISGIIGTVGAYTLYSEANCSIASFLGLFSYYTCYDFPFPTGTVIGVPTQCSVPAPPPPPPAPVPAPPTAPNATNCVYLYTGSSCSGSPLTWQGAPCDNFCTEVAPEILVSLDCSGNFTGVYEVDSTFIGCTNFVNSGIGCVNIVPPLSGFSSLLVVFDSICPPEPTIPPAPAPAVIPSPTPAGTWCRIEYSFPGCSLSADNGTVGNCYVCDNTIYMPRCDQGNITRYASGPCTGSTVASFPFGQCYDDGFGASRIYYLGNCVAPAPAPAPPTPAPVCATFWKPSLVCAPFSSTITEPEPGYCFNASYPSLGASFFSSSAYKSFKFDCPGGKVILYTTTDCTGSTADFYFATDFCTSFLTGPVYAMSAGNTSCGACPRRAQHTQHYSSL